MGLRFSCLSLPFLFACDAGQASEMPGQTGELECSLPAVSGFGVWETQVVGGTQSPPESSSPLRALDGGVGTPCGGDTACEMHIEWTIDPPDPSTKWGTVNIPLANRGEYTHNISPQDYAVDLGAAGSVTLTYASEGPLVLQLRTSTTPHGGDHFRIILPPRADSGPVDFSFSEFRRPEGGAAPGPEILSDGFSFTLATSESAWMTLRQIEVSGYVPPCD